MGVTMKGEGKNDKKIRHECPEMLDHFGSRSGPVDEKIPGALWGPAITNIEMINGKWWAHNEEYSTEISFCPWCGTRL